MKQRVIAWVMAFFMVAAFSTHAQARDELKNTDPDKYYILLDLNNQIVTVFEQDEQGAYTRIVRRFVCTSGRTDIDPDDPEDKGTPTPRGIWKIGGRERFGKFAAFAGEYARYWTQIVGSVYFHSAMFARRDINAFKASPYRSLGNNISHGCVRLYVEDAKWLYYFACPGTVVNVSTSEAPNGSLTKKLKSTMPFKEYNELQKNFFDHVELPNFKAWITAEGADMRTGNGSNDRRIMNLPLDTEVEILQLGDPWCKVTHNKKEGYVKTAYLTFERGTIQSKEDADIIRGTIYVQQAPDKKAGVIFKVPTYTSVKILDTNFEDYAKIEVWGVIGYVPKSSLIKGWGMIRK